MSFSVLAGVITQTGTDADLSGLVGLAGVTVLDSSTADKSFITYDIGVNKLVISGTLTINPTNECLCSQFVPSGSDNAIDISGTLTVGVKEISGSLVKYSEGNAIICAGKGGSSTGQRSFDVGASGTLNWYGGVLSLQSPMNFASGATVNWESGTIYNTRNDFIQLRISSSGTTNNARINFTGLTLDGLTSPVAIFANDGFGEMQLKLFRGQFQNGVNLQADALFVNWDNLNSFESADLLANSNGTNFMTTTFRNVGRQTTVVERIVNRDAFAITDRDCKINFLDANGDPVVEDVSYYGVDTDNGSRFVGYNGVDLTANQVYSGVTTAGFAEENIISQVMEAFDGTITYDDRTNANGNIPINAIAYSSTIGTAFPELIGLNQEVAPLFLLEDFSLTETVKATVDAYTTLDTSRELYDRAKSYLYDNYLGETSTIVGRAGTEILGNNLAFVMNETGTAFAFDGSVVTFASPSFTGGFVDATISHGTGTTLFNNLVLENSTWNVDQLTWSGSADANSIIDVANSGSYDATSFIFNAASTINNSSGVAIDVTLNAGQPQPLTTGSAVNFIVVGIAVTFNNLTLANVQIIEDDNITVNQRYISQTGSLVYAVPALATGTYKYVINRAGYFPIVGSFDTAGGNVSVDGSQTQKLLTDGSAMYMGTSSVFLTVMPLADGSRMNLRVGDGSISAINAFDEVEDALQTENGMTYLANGGGEISIALLPTGTFVFLENNVRLIRDNAGDSNATVSSFVQSTDGQVLDNTNGEIQFITPNSDVNIVSVQGVDVVNVDDFKADVSAIETKAQADARQALLIAEHDQTQADIAALNDFNPATDTVANVTLVATTTTNTDMRGTDGANTIAPDNASITSILADTNELQTNQGDWLTATGFATPTDVTNSQTAIVAEVNANETKIDIIDTNVDAIKLKTDTLVNTDLTGIALSSEIAALNDFDPTLDTVARVTLVDTTTSNTDMRGTDGANTIAPDNASIGSILADTNELQLNQGNFATATGFSTPTDVSNAQTAIISEVNANETKIDAIETKAQADIRQTALLAQHTATQGLITALNDLSAADVNAQVDAALLDYDGPTKAELDAAQSAIESAISGLNNLDATAVSQAVWDYLQSSTTVAASMKEAVEITLKNAKLIPATI